MEISSVAYQRSLVGHSPWGHKESDTTECLSTLLLPQLPAHTYLKPLLRFFLLPPQCLAPDWTLGQMRIRSRTPPGGSPRLVGEAHQTWTILTRTGWPARGEPGVLLDTGWASSLPTAPRGRMGMHAAGSNPSPSTFQQCDLSQGSSFTSLCLIFLLEK